MEKNILDNKVKIIHNSSGSQLPRETFSNLFKLLKERDMVEIFKVLRRRLLNSVKFVKRYINKFFGIIYNHPRIYRYRMRRRMKHLLFRIYGYGVKRDESNKHIALVVDQGSYLPKSSAFIRLINPLTHNTITNIYMELFDEDTTRLGNKFDCCIVQRTAFSNEKNAEQFVKNMRLTATKIILDTDDAFSSIDNSHPEYDLHSQRIRAKEVIANAADQIWVSTNVLANIYKKINHNTFVVKNALDERIWKKAVKLKNSSKKIQILYMGTATHDNDFALVLPALDELAKTYPNSFELTVIGAVTDLPERSWAKRLYQPKSIYPKFVRWFLKQGPFDIGLSPLVDSEFNRSKSDIKCLDYLAAGIMPVVSDILPYQDPELKEFVIKVTNDSRAWVTAIEKIIKDPQEFRAKKEEKITTAQKYIWQNRSAEKTATILKEHLEKLLS